jgi:hypothetical protein
MRSITLLLSIALLLLIDDVKAQVLVRGFGISTGFSTTAPAKVLHPQPNTLPLFTDSFNRESKNAFLIGLSLPLYLRLASFNNESSLAIHTVPMLGAYIAGTNFEEGYDSYYGEFGPYGVPLYISVPLVLQYSRGMLASPESIADRGFGVGLGMEYQLMLDKFAHYPNGAEIATYEVGSTILWRPVAQLSYRYWNAFDIPVELSLHASYWRDQFNGQSVTRPTFRLSWVAYLNY